MSQKKSFLQVAFGATLIGLSAVFARHAQEASPSVVAFYRMAMALPMVLLITRGDCARLWGRHSAWAFLAGIAFAGDLILWHASMHYTSIAVATFLIGLCPLWVTCYQFLFQGLRPHPRFWLALTLALLGAVGLATAGKVGLGKGEILGVLGSFFYAAYTLFFSKARTTLNAHQTLFFVMLGVMATTGFTALVQGDPFVGFTDHTWWALLGLAVVVQVIAWSLISMGMGQLTASASSVVLLMQQVSTLFLGMIFFAEYPTPIQALGAGLIIVGIGLVGSARHRNPLAR